MRKIGGIVQILFICGLIDSFFRAWLFQFYLLKGEIVANILAGWLYALFGLLFVGDGIAYVFFASFFQLFTGVPFFHKHRAWLYPLLGALLAGLLFALTGRMRFWTTQQLTIMGIVYPLLGGLYGYLYRRWISPITP